MDDSQETSPPLPSRRTLVVVSAAVGLAVAAVLLASAPGLPMVWDEGNAIRRAEGIARWTARWSPADGEARQPRPWTDEAIQRNWAYTTKVEGHPAFYGIVIAAGRAVSGGWLAPLGSARFGPIVLFALAAGAMFYRLGRQYSLAAATSAVVAMLLLPRLFAHLHFASFDGPLVSCWILAWATFEPACRRRCWATVFGIALGMTLSVKATGWFAPVPFVVWAAAYRDRAAAKALMLALPVAGLTFYAMNPPLWFHPLGGMLAFLDLNLHRAAHGWNIPTQFFGRLYDLNHPLPWYNTLAWTAVTVPLPLLLLFGTGLAVVLRHPRLHKAGMLLVANWLVLLVVRALPGTPPHDGVRLFLPSFAFLAALTGIGTAWVLGRLSAPVDSPGSPLKRGATAGLSSSACPNLPETTAGQAGSGTRRWIGVVMLYLAAATSLVWYSPHWLSYYNLALGGLPGATALGMEPTYYWDGLDSSVLDWLHENTPEGDKIRFAAGPSENLAMMRRWGSLRRDFRPEAPGEFQWYVLQHRPSAWQSADRWLIEHGAPRFRKTLGPGGWGPWRRDLPLVKVYPYRQYLRACEASKDER